MAIVRQTAAFDIQGVRKRLYKRLAVPPDILNHAFDKLRKKLDAKETKFFTHQGQVIEKVEVEDHATQLSAIDKVLAVGAAYAKESDNKSVKPTVGIRVDPRTGVIEVVVGSQTGDAYEMTQAANGDEGHGELASAVQLELGDGHGDDSSESDAAEQVQVIKVKNNGNGRGMPAEVLRQLFDGGSDG